MEENRKPEAPPSARRGLQRWRRYGGVLSAAAWLYATFCLALWALLQAGDLWWPATVLMFSPRWVVALPAAALALAAAGLRPRALVPTLLAFGVTLGPVMGLHIPLPHVGGDPPRGPLFRVLTHNLHYKKGDTAALGRWIAEARPDVVALQEWPGSGEDFAGGGWYVHRAPGLFLASRHPVRRAERLGAESTSERGSVMRYELATPWNVVTLFSVHLATPRYGLLGVAREGEEGAEGLAANSRPRWGQSEALAREAGAAAGPVLLAGDFNTPPESAIFRRVWGGYADAFAASGWGWGYTFFGGRTGVRIDHVLAGPGWRCGACRVGPDTGSPHRPLLAELTWEGPVDPPDVPDEGPWQLPERHEKPDR